MKKLYAAQRAESPEEGSESQSPDFVYLKERLYAPRLKDDLNILSAYASETQPAGYSLVQKVFGQQLEQSKVRISHLGHLLQERAVIYNTHMYDLNQQGNDLKNLLTIARRPYGFHTLQQIASLEKVALSSESEERRERLAFWKDTAEIRDRMLDSAIEYRSTRGRANLFAPPEAKYG